MKDLDLYKFVTTNDLEYHCAANRDLKTAYWFKHNEIKITEEYSDVILFVPNYHIDEWKDLLGESIFDEEGLECTMKHGYFCFWMKDICDYFGITMFDVFKFEDKIS